MTQSVEYLRYKHEDLSFISKQPHKKQHVVGYICVGDLETSSHLSDDIWFRKRHCLKISWRTIEQDIWH